MLSLPGQTQVARDYGPLRAGTRIDLEPGYSVLIGENNSGKSALLQYLFLETQQPQPNDQAAILQSNRSFLPDSLVPSIHLTQWNAGFDGNYRGRPRTFESSTGPPIEQLFSALMLGDF